jgi:hypothetical protein
MARNLEINQHLQVMTNFQEALNTARSSGALSELDKRNDVYVRVNASGYRLVSLLDKTPLGGLSPTSVKTPGELLEHLGITPQEPGRSVPERRLQAWIIRQAQVAAGDLRKVLQIPSDEYKELIFAFDEVSPTPEIRCDILAVGKKKERYVPVVIELKYDRQQKELLKQLDGFSNLIRDHQDSFSELFRARTGLSVVCSDPEKILVWPWSTRPNLNHAKKRKEYGVLEIAYRIEPSKNFEFLFETGK